ncbi:MAG TPA: M28 family peptidase, partial [Phycisphaerales bacterium]|nr:M28 family peptidase [Phycisphaerales bacterium]
VAGTAGDLRTAAEISDAFKSMGLSVEQHEIWVHLCRPVAAELELIETGAGDAATPTRTSLPIHEAIIPQDRYSAADGLSFGWNAYSGSGDVTAPVVYANYGTKADFARLAELGVDVRGRIVLARYGGNYRGYKAKFAEQAGAVGLIIYTDPADSGYCKGLVYPEGGYANDTCIQRGSVLTLGYAGDPLTPGMEATRDADRLAPESVDLPRIPVQPVGWGAAQQILAKLRGPAVPEGWQGGLPFTYRLTGGEDAAAPRVRMRVEQERFLARTFNVVATLPGTTEPERLVILGAHHDAWGFGASDPLAGTVCVLEIARGFAEAARAGLRPRRTLVFAAWGAEEFGIIGSTEWVEARRRQLTDDAVAYINLDMAAMGPDFGASASPSLRRAIREAAGAVPQARNPDRTVLRAWTERTAGAPSAEGPPIGDIGGGSDHVAFLCHAGVASAGLGAGGAKGTSYHSVYDNLEWYWKVVGHDYEPALMVVRVAGTLAAGLAGDPIVPLDPAGTAEDFVTKLEALEARCAAAPALARADLAALLESARAHRDRARALARRWRERADAGDIDEPAAASASAALMALDRAWLDEAGLPGRPWYKNLYAATDEDSGYASWVLPLLVRAVERGDPGEFAEAIERTRGALERAEAQVARLEALVRGSSR